MRKFLIVSIIFLTLISCNNSKEKPKPSTFLFAKGADISWVTQMENEGIKFYNRNGQEMECTALMRELGINSIRLRVWVNPKDGWCGKEDLLVKARRAKQLGMRLMIDFHYSDWWADPGKQNKPEAWKDLSNEQLISALQNHTEEILIALKNEEITPTWVQIGNETTDGMLWESGRASKNMPFYTKLTNAGYYSTKKIFPDAKVIIHIDNGYDKGRFEWIFDGLKANGGKWDVIGMSLYPESGDWQIKSDQCIENISSLIKRYGSEVMICEVGMSWDKGEECKNFLTYLISKGKSIPYNKCLGVFYWEPQSNPIWGGYTKGAFDDKFYPTIAMDAFKQ